MTTTAVGYTPTATRFCKSTVILHSGVSTHYLTIQTIFNCEHAADGFVSAFDDNSIHLVKLLMEHTRTQYTDNRLRPIS